MVGQITSWDVRNYATGAGLGSILEVEICEVTSLLTHVLGATFKCDPFRITHGHLCKVGSHIRS